MSQEKIVISQEKIRWKFSMPHTYIIIGIVIVFVMILTYVVPAGQFDRAEDPVTGRTLVVPDSFHSVEQSPVNIFRMFIDVGRGMTDAANIIFFVFFAYGAVYMLIKTGTFNGAVGALLRKTQGKEKYVIPLFMLFFGICGATYGMYEETYGLIPVFMGLAVAMGYDPLVGAAIVLMGVSNGFSAAIINPFTVGVAQGIAEVPMFSGIGLRIVIWAVTMALVIWYTMRYAARVKAKPELSIVKGIDFPLIANIDKNEIIEAPFTTKHKITMLAFVLTIVILVYGTIKLGWYIDELSALFIITMLVLGLINGFSFSKIASVFIEGSSQVVFGAFVIGIARAVLLILQDGCIIDSVVYYLAQSVASFSTYVAAEMMFIVQTLLNFFIPSGSGQAAASMPIMVPLSDLVGVNRQIAVLAFQFGDGFSNQFWPASICCDLAIAGIPLDRWYKFYIPIGILLLIMQFVFMAIAVAINYGPI